MLEHTISHVHLPSNWNFNEVERVVLKDSVEFLF